MAMELELARRPARPYQVARGASGWRARSSCDRHDSRHVAISVFFRPPAVRTEALLRPPAAGRKWPYAGTSGLSAEEEGFEPSVPVLPGQRFSRSLHDGLHDRRARRPHRTGVLAVANVLLSVGSRPAFEAGSSERPLRDYRIQAVTTALGLPGPSALARAPASALARPAGPARRGARRPAKPT